MAFAAIAAQTGDDYLVATSQMLFGITVAVVVVAFLFLALAMRREPLATGFPAAAAAAFGFIYVVVPLAMLVQLRQQGSGAFLILYVLIVVWIGDTAAYYTGRALGRHKLAPRISPGKTWEGTVGSFVGAIVCGTLVFAYSRQIGSGLISVGLLTPGQAYLPPRIPPLWQFGALSAAINIAAQIGDLAESLIKRGAGVKDSGNILPGHGGMLDRIDALLFAAPVIWYYAAFRVLS
ncbi:MAG: phosphatidate cytidylyltransferase [Acidobacteriia bacterium]|nr:phosphatidate cytidylyltransferase [Terriglobia bacterium]